MLFDLNGPLSLAAHVRGGAQAGPHVYVEERPNVRERTMRMAVLAAGVLLCAGHRGKSLLRLNGCAGAEFSGALARGTGLAEERAAFRGDVGVLAQLSARLRLYRGWGVMLLATGRVSLVKRRFLYTVNGNSSLAYEMERASLSVAFGPSYEF